MHLGFRHGVVVAALLTAVFLSVSYVGWKLGGLPFVPFDLFDWAARALPGAVVTFAIDAGIALSRIAHVDAIGDAAKNAEQAIALATTMCVSVAIGGLFVIALRFSEEPAGLFGTLTGAMMGGTMLLIERRLDRIGPGAALAASWVVGTLTLWGFALGWVCDRLRAMSRNPSTIPGPPGGDVLRRQFLIRVTYGAAIPSLLTALWALIVGRKTSAAPGARWSDDHVLPNATSPVRPVPGTRPEFTPLDAHYRIDADTRVPPIDAGRWRLRITGLVDSPRELTLDELRRAEPLHQFITLSCISNPLGGDLIGTTRWTGVSVQRLLEQVTLRPRATHLRIRSADGFFEVVSLEKVRQDPRVMLTYAWDGVPLLPEHGFPLRIYVPDVYGMKQPKWVVALEVTDRWESGYWVVRGWDREGRTQNTSAVDAVDVRGDAPSEGRHTLRAGGIAFAGARGISKVEARIDQGPWQQAELRDPLSNTTWTIWRATLQSGEGGHVVSVRSYEADGTPQEGRFHSKRTPGLA